MFEYLKDYRVVLVSGPHRSGTTITTKMIAHDTGARYCPEEAFGHDNVEAWRALIAEPGRKVIQCPSMCAHLGEPGGADDVAVVMVWRSMSYILASQERIGWAAGGAYASRYRAELALYGSLKRPLASIKYAEWEHGQSQKIANPFDVTYGSLVPHPLWLPKSARANFGPRQIAL